MISEDLLSIIPLTFDGGDSFVLYTRINMIRGHLPVDFVAPLCDRYLFLDWLPASQSVRLFSRLPTVLGVIVLLSVPPSDIVLASFGNCLFLKRLENSESASLSRVCFVL